MCLQLLSLDRDLGDFFAPARQQGHRLCGRADRRPWRAGHSRAPAPAGRAGRRPGRCQADRQGVGAAVGAKLGLKGPVLYGEGIVRRHVCRPRAVAGATRLGPRLPRSRPITAHPQVEAVFTEEQLAATPSPTAPPDQWSLIERARASFDPERSGDFVVLLKRDITPIADTEPAMSRPTAARGTMTGACRSCSGGAGMAADRDRDAIETADIMPTLAAIDRPCRRSGVDRRRNALTACSGRYLSGALSHLKTLAFFTFDSAALKPELSASGRGCMRRVAVGAVGVGRARGLRPDRANMPTSNSRRRRAITSCWSCGPTSASDRSRPAAWSSRAPTGPRQARAKFLDRASKAQQAARGGNVAHHGAARLAARRRSRDDRRARAAALCGRPVRSRCTNIPAPICRPSAARASTGRWARTRSRSASRPATTMRCSSTPRTASPRPAGSRCRCWASPAASSAFARPTSAAAASSPMPAWSTSGPAKWSGSTSLQAGSQVAGIKMGDIRTAEGAAQMVDRLLDRMKPGRNVAAPGASAQ